MIIKKGYRRILDYAIAIALPSIFIAFKTLVFGTSEEHPPFLLLITAVLVSAVEGGIGPGLVATAVSVTGAYLFSFAPRDHAIGMIDIVAMVTFVIEATIVTWLSSLYLRTVDELRDNRKRLQQAKDDLEQQVSRRTSELVETMGKLEQVYMNQKRFVADASHDLRTPLTVIEGEVRNLLRGSDHSPPTIDSLRRIDTHARRLSTIANDLLLLARLETRRGIEEERPVRLDEMVIDCLSRMTPRAVGKRIAWNVQIDDAVEVTGDAQALDRAFTNLLENAVTYSHDDATIDVSLHRSGGHASLTITDRHITIPDDERERIFDRFHRGNELNAADGTGMGLSIVKAVVEAHEGEIRVDSSQADGTSFIISLPL